MELILVNRGSNKQTVKNLSPWLPNFRITVGTGLGSQGEQAMHLMPALIDRVQFRDVVKV